MNAYRKQQLEIAAAIDSGDYDRASDLLRQDVQTFAQPPPERSGTTGHYQTLTRRRKCGIIKLIRRKLRRAKIARRDKPMKNYEFGFYSGSGEFFEIREHGFDNGKKLYVTATSAENAYSEFIEILSGEFCSEEMTVREIPTGHDMTGYAKL